jgi:hypothetical protein
MKKRINGLIVLLIMSIELSGALAPYIPSYDERYREDIAQAKGNKDCFIEPADGLNYVDYHYLGAHTAEKYPRFFPQYSLQNQTIPGMLYAGVRGLMLSAYSWTLGWSTMERQGFSIVCSHPTKESKVLRKNGKPLYQTLYYEMNRIFNFLKSHPKAVITVFLYDFKSEWTNTENVIEKILRDMRGIIEKNEYNPILKPADWPAAQQKGEWPTLGWMRQNNKRLVIFTQTCDQHTTMTWPVKQYFWTNVYGTVDDNLICTPEKESALEADKKNRKLVSFGCFGGVAYVPDAKVARDITYCLDYDIAKRLTTGCQKKGFGKAKLPNCYWADRIIGGLDALRKEGKKTACDYINELNAAVSH